MKNKQPDPRQGKIDRLIKLYQKDYNFDVDWKITPEELWEIDGQLYKYHFHDEEPLTDNLYAAAVDVINTWKIAKPGLFIRRLQISDEMADRIFYRMIMDDRIEPNPEVGWGFPYQAPFNLKKTNLDGE